MFDMEVNWFINIFRTLFAFLDWIVYSFIAFLFRAVFNLANFELVGFYESFETRVYVILGIFMLFKVTISLITYLVNPEKITDKEQGAAKIVIRIITVLVMLIALPTFFDLMTEAQNKLLPVVPRIIVGTANTLSSEDASGIADNMAVTMLQGFAHLKEGCDGEEISSPTDMLENINNVCSEENNIYAYDYLPIVSTLVGLVMCYAIFSLCISVAIRAFKLIILRMMAPVPVISYVDPKSAKDGMFSHWTKTFISTWAELFINLGIIYFIVYIIDFILSADAWKGFFDGISGTWAVLDGIILLAFVIIGLLMFAKSAPQFIFDALGIKNKGNFTKMLGMGAAAGMAGSAISAYRTRQKYDAENKPGESHKLRNFGASLFNGLASGAAAGEAILSSDKPTLRTGFDAQAKYNASNLSGLSVGATAAGGAKSFFQDLLYGQTDIDQMQIRWKEEEEKIKYDKQRNAERKTIMDRASSKGLESLKTSANISGFTGVTGRSYHLKANAAKFNSVYQAAMDRGEEDSFEFVDETGRKFQIKMDDAQLLQHEINDGNIADYAEQALVGTIDDSVITGADARFASANNGVGVERTFGGPTGLKATYGNETNNITSREISIANEKNDKQVQRMQAEEKMFKNNGK